MTNKPKPQDVRQKIADWFEDWTDGVPGCADKESNLAFADAIIRAFPVLAQSMVIADAQPVAQLRSKGSNSWVDCSDSALKYVQENSAKYDWRILYTAPPRRDASGLIEAAEIYRKALERISKSNAYDMNTLHPEGCAHVAAEALRAANRSAHGEAIPDCPTKGVAARQGNGG